jgi:hypothetical protein
VYRATTQTPKKEIPFSRAFSNKADMSVELWLVSFHTSYHDLNKNPKELRMSLNLVEERMEQTSMRMAMYQHKVKKYNNNNVKSRRFNMGDLIL